jgi:cell division transport system permease protein
VSRFRRRLAVPLDRDRATRSLALIIAVMVYLASLALAVTLGLGAAVARWNDGLTGTMTVQVPPDAAARLPALVAALGRVPGVRSADVLGEAQTAALLEPWLGKTIDTGDLPLPRLVDLRVDPGALDEAGLRRIVAENAPGGVLDDHRRWIDPLIGAATAIRIAGLAVLALVAASAVIVVVFATRAGLAAHHGVVEVLHLIGARDGYIARQFEVQALRLGIGGGLAGLALAALTLAGVAWAAAAPAELRLVPSLVPPESWVFLVLLPVVVGIVAMLTARVTVLRALARMP